MGPTFLLLVERAATLEPFMGMESNGGLSVKKLVEYRAPFSDPVAHLKL